MKGVGVCDVARVGDCYTASYPVHEGSCTFRSTVFGQPSASGATWKRQEGQVGKGWHEEGVEQLLGSRGSIRGNISRNTA